MSLRSQVAIGANGPPSLVLAVSGGTDIETLNVIARTLLGDSTPRKLHLHERPIHLSVYKQFTVSNQFQHAYHFAHQFGTITLTNTRDSSLVHLPRACGIIGLSFLLNGNQYSCFPFTIVTHRLLALFSPWHNMAVPLINEITYPFIIVITVHQTNFTLAQYRRIGYLRGFQLI
jgi:hypothetical protein